MACSWPSDSLTHHLADPTRSGTCQTAQTCLRGYIGVPRDFSGVPQAADSIGSGTRRMPRPCWWAAGPKWLVQAARKPSAAKVEGQHEPKEWLKVWDAFVAAILGSDRVGRHNAGVQRRWINASSAGQVTFLLGEVVGQATARGIPEDDGNRGRLEAPEAVTPSLRSLTRKHADILEECGPACIAAVILVSSEPESPSASISSENLPAGLGCACAARRARLVARRACDCFHVSSTVFADHPNTKHGQGTRSTQCRRGPVV